MRIALFTDSFLPGTGGTENVVLRLGTELSKEHEVAVFAPDYHRPFDDNKFPFKVYRSKSVKITGNEQWATPALCRNTKRAIKEFKPDIIHSHTQGMMAEFANNYARKNNIPSICTSHTKYKYCYDSAVGIPFIVNMVVKRVVRRLRLADKACAVSYSMVEELKNYGLKKPVTVVRNGHNLLGLERKQYKKNEKFTLLFVGLIVDYKNIDFSLRALQELKKTRSDFVFNIVGDGPHRKRFEKRVKELNLDDCVKFLGRITDREKLFEIYANADAMLFTSEFDTDGLVLLEAAEAGTPSLVIKGTGAAERYSDGETAFIAENDIRSVVEKITYLMENPEQVEKVGKNALNVFVPWGEIAKQYIDIYNEEIANKK